MTFDRPERRNAPTLEGLIRADGDRGKGRHASGRRFVELLTARAGDIADR